MADFVGIRLVTASPTPKTLAPSGVSEKAAPIKEFTPAVWQLKKQ